jgi:hypothetical protein
LDVMVTSLKADWLITVQQLWLLLGMGILVWAIIMTPVSFLLYQLILPIFHKIIEHRLHHEEDQKNQDNKTK